jgi:6-pyruvoyltetrahydropterin/6-carboxytetrahydropterin synthase
MLSVTKEFTFDSAHRLKDYDGACSRLHGHTYKLQVTVFSGDDQLDRTGMLIDFSKLKSAVKEEIIEEFDHRYLNDVLGANPTAEYMCLYIFAKLAKLPLFADLAKMKIRLWETPTSYATYQSEL